MVNKNKNEGVDLLLGYLPGVIERGRLLRTSLRIGVGDSLRFLREDQWQPA